MDDAKKKQLNDAIAVLREECKKHCSCDLCPIGQKIDGENFCTNPCAWKDIDYHWLRGLKKPIILV